MQIRALSVSEVNQYIKRILISDPILAHIHVKGEMSNYNPHSSGHMYFTLKDKGGRINCVMFRSDCERLKFVPKEGMSLVCKGYISLYERSGQYQLYVRDMEPAGIGALYIAYLQLKERLEKEGIFDAKYKKQLPYIPKKIAVITSPTGAAVRDIISIILRRFPKVELYVFPVSVQGETAAPSIVDAIDMCNSFSDIDVAIVGRGGGSMEELWAFNEEEVARAIFRSSVPKEYKNLAEKRLLNSINAKINILQQKLSLVENNYFFKYPLNPIHEKQQYIDDLVQRLNKSLKTEIEFKKKHLTHMGERLNALGPLSVFSRGYSVVRDEDEKIIKSVDQVEKDKILNIDLIDGRVNCKVVKYTKGERVLVRS